MNEKEQQIISCLRKDARTSLASISKEVQMPISTISDKIRRLHQNKFIKKHTALVDFSKLGYHHHVHLALKINKAQKKDFLFFLQNHQNINSIYEINGGFDFMVETVHKDIKEYILFMESLQEAFEIREFQEYHVLEEIEKERFL